MKTRKPKLVVMPKKDDNFVGTIDMNEVRGKVRKPFPPPGQRHRQKTDYRRKPKHPKKGEE